MRGMISTDFACLSARSRFFDVNSLVALRKVCGADLSAHIKRSDFGMGYGIPMVADDVLLRVNVEAIGPN